jgi:DNA-binding XRE family transcriptional regulator/carbonic anhydrase/acetyltransferase-like protein (isoleucine patch superfamily)
MKYELTYETKVLETGEVLHRIRALEDFGDVIGGDLGGWIESEMNLGVVGNCWVYDEACVYGEAIVSIDATVRDTAHVYGKAGVIGEAEVYDNARVHENGQVLGGQVYGEAQVFGQAKLFDDAYVHGNARVFGYAEVFGDARVFEDAEVFENAKVFGDAEVYGSAQIYGNAEVLGNANVCGDAQLHGQQKAYGYAENKPSVHATWSAMRENTLSAAERIKSDAFVFIICTLVARRKELEMSQIELAEKVGISQTTLSRIESGDATPGLNTVYKIGMALGMDFKLVPKV